LKTELADQSSTATFSKGEKGKGAVKKKEERKRGRGWV